MPDNGYFNDVLLLWRPLAKTSLLLALIEDELLKVRHVQGRPYSVDLNFDPVLLLAHEIYNPRVIKESYINEAYWRKSQLVFI